MLADADLENNTAFHDDLMYYAQEVAALEQRVERFHDALIWCSGSDDFQEGGKARVGWLKLGAPLLEALAKERSMSEKTNKELVLEGRDKGRVVFLQFDGEGYAVMSAPIDEFIKQPADGILYDLNRLEEIALTYMEDPKWVNDFAVALTIRELHKRVERLQNDLAQANEWLRIRDEGDAK